MINEPNTPLWRLRQVLGSVSAIAKAAGVSRQAVYQWQRIPPHKVVALSDATGGKISPDELSQAPQPAGGGTASSDDKWVYALRGGPFIKIGISRDPVGRMTALQSGSAFKLELLATCRGRLVNESSLQRRIEAHRVNGEWFRDCDEVNDVVEFIKSTNTMIGTPKVEKKSKVLESENRILSGKAGGGAVPTEGSMCDIISALAKELGASEVAIQKWRERGRVPPYMQLEIMDLAAKKGITVERAAMRQFSRQADKS